MLESYLENQGKIPQEMMGLGLMGIPRVIKCSLMRSQVTGLDAELFKQHAKQEKKGGKGHS